MSDKEININIKTTADTSGADQTAEAINKTREAAQGAGEGADAIDKTTTALNNAKKGAEEVTKAVQDSEKVEEGAANAAKRAAEAEEARQQKAAAALKIIEEARRRDKASLEELSAELVKYQSIAEKASQQGNFVVKLDAVKNIQDLEKRIEALTKAEERQTKAAEKAAKAAEKEAAALQKQKEEAEKAAAAAKKQGEALEQTGRKGQQAGAAVARGSNQGAAAIKNMGGGALQTAYILDDLQYGIRGVMNNIPGLVMSFGGSMGLAGALSIATLSGKVLYDWLGNSADKSDELAKKQLEKNKELAEFLRDAETQRIDFVKKSKQEEAANAINAEYEQYVKNITYEYEKQTREIERQLALKKREIARKLDVDTDNNEMQRLNIERQYESGKISKHEREYKLLLLEQSLDSLIEQARIKTAHAEALALAEKQGEAEGKRNSALDEKGRLENIKISLPTIEEMAGVFREQSSSRSNIEGLNNSLRKTEEKIEELKKDFSNALKRNYGFESRYSDIIKQNIKNLQDEQQRLLTLKGQAQKAFNNATSQISKTRERLEEEQIPFNPSYGLNSNGKPVTDEQRAEEYKTALEKISSRQEKLTKAVEKYNDALEKAVENLKDKEEELADLTAKSYRRDGIRNEVADVGKIKWKNEEKKETEKEQKKLEKERERELKRLQREQKQEADKAIKTFVEGFTLNTGKSATPHQTTLVHKAIDGIRKDIERAAADGNIDPEEMRDLGKLFVGKLMELGVASRQAIQGLKQAFESNIGAINKEINEIRRTQRMQLSRERLGR